MSIISCFRLFADVCLSGLLPCAAVMNAGQIGRVSRADLTVLQPQIISRCQSDKIIY